MADLSGQQLGQYTLINKLGEGGMAAVYRARQVSMGRDIAIKIIESKLASNPEFLRRFEREAHTVAALDHPHILKVFDFGRQGDLLYLVMEIKNGGSLAALIRDGNLALPHAITLIDQIASALDYAHRQGIIHRDLKPQNVLLDASGNAVLTDFGIAKAIQGDSTVLTQSGIAMGTPAYMPPEQWYGRNLDARSDLYAFGIMVYEMLSGRVPFTADTPPAMMYQHLNEAPPPIRTLRSDLPSFVEGVIRRALAKDPAQRFQTGAEFANALKMALSGQTPTGLPISSASTGASGNYPSQPMSRRNSLPILVLLGAIIVLLVGGGFVLLNSVNRSNPSTGSPVATTDLAVAQAATTEQTSLATASLTLTFTPSATATWTSTLDVQQAALEALKREQTLTATNYTRTPTPNLTETIGAEKRRIVAQTQAYEASQTAAIEASYTRTATQTFTSTATPSETLTTTRTFTPSATSTWTPTLTLTFTSTATATATATASNTPSRTPTATRTFTVTPSPTLTFTASPTRPPTATPVPLVYSGRILFTAYLENPGSNQLFIINSDGAKLRQLTNDNSNQQPNWSPDGSQIAFTKSNVNPPAFSRIWIMNADQSEPQPLTSKAGGYDIFPVWSPTGDSIAFLRFYSGPISIEPPIDLFVINVKTGAEQLVGKNLDLSYMSDYEIDVIRWSLDGAQIRVREMCYNRESGSAETCRDLVPLANVSPDGKFTATITSDSNAQLAIDGKAITNSNFWVGANGLPVWQPPVQQSCVFTATTPRQLREDASSSAATAGQLAGGESLTAIGIRYTSDGSTWYKLKNNLWIKRGLGTVVGDCFALPDA